MNHEWIMNESWMNHEWIKNIKQSQLVSFCLFFVCAQFLQLFVSTFVAALSFTLRRAYKATLRNPDGYVHKSQVWNKTVTAIKYFSTKKFRKGTVGISWLFVDIDRIVGHWGLNSKSCCGTCLLLRNSRAVMGQSMPVRMLWSDTKPERFYFNKLYTLYEPFVRQCGQELALLDLPTWKKNIRLDYTGIVIDGLS